MLRLFTRNPKEYGPLQALPVSIYYLNPKEQRCELKEEDGRASFVQTYTAPVQLTAKDVDAKAVLDVFLKVQTPVQAKDYLASCGPFFPPTEEQPNQQEITWEEFQSWQNFVGERYVGHFPENPSKGLFPRVSPPLALDGRVLPKWNSENEDHLLVTCDCAITVMTTYIITEQKAGRIYLKCHNENCTKPSRIYPQGRKGSKFCDEKCQKAHGERIRKRNKREAELAALAAQ